MVINEQGLNDSTQTLRTVKAHESFRAIFVLSQKSLELCLLADKNSLADLASEQLDARIMDWSLSHL